MSENAPIKSSEMPKAVKLTEAEITEKYKELFDLNLSQEAQEFFAGLLKANKWREHS